MRRSAGRVFPEFSLSRLLKTVFEPKSGQRIDILMDLPDDAWTPEGRQVSLTKDVYPDFELLPCISTYSATAPLTAFAKQFGFRGATLHGVNPIILRTGLAVDYNEVSRQAEKLRLAMTRADAFEIDFEVSGRNATLKLLCDRQEAQKSHGLCRGDKPDVVNLPAGEVYFVPTGADGQFPRRYEDGSVGLLDVAEGRIRKATLLSGNPATVDDDAFHPSLLRPHCRNCV